jgi:hypothetical protein
MPLPEPLRCRSKRGKRGIVFAVGGISLGRFGLRTVASHMRGHHAINRLAPLGIPRLIFEPRRHSKCISLQKGSSLGGHFESLRHACSWSSDNGASLPGRGASPGKRMGRAAFTGNEIDHAGTGPFRSLWSLWKIEAGPFDMYLVYQSRLVALGHLRTDGERIADCVHFGTDGADLEQLICGGRVSPHRG